MDFPFSLAEKQRITSRHRSATQQHASRPERKNALVLQCGTGQIRVGFAGQLMPSMVLAAVCGQKAAPDAAAAAAEASADEEAGEEILFGEELRNDIQADLGGRWRPIFGASKGSKGNPVCDWEDVASTFEHIAASLDFDTADHGLCLTEASAPPRPAPPRPAA